MCARELPPPLCLNQASSSPLCQGLLESSVPDLSSLGLGTDTEFPRPVERRRSKSQNFLHVSLQSCHLHHHLKVWPGMFSCQNWQLLFVFAIFGNFYHPYWNYSCPNIAIFGNNLIRFLYRVQLVQILPFLAII